MAKKATPDLNLLAQMMAVVSQMMCLVPTKLTKDNYCLWRDQVYPLIKSVNLLDHLGINDDEPAEETNDDGGDEPAEGTKDDEEVEETNDEDNEQEVTVDGDEPQGNGLTSDDWKLMDPMLRSFIVATLFKSVHKQVLEQTDPPLDTAKDLWNYLDKSFNETSEETQGEDGKELEYLPLYKAAVKGEWNRAKSIFNRDSSSRTADLTGSKENVLHIAICAGNDIQFIKNLVDEMPEESLGEANEYGCTTLHYAAIAGNTEAVRKLVDKNPKLAQSRNPANETPLHCAADYAHKETVEFLLSVTRNEDPSPFTGESGATLLNYLIMADFYDIALSLLKTYPSLARERDDQEASALDTLAKKPQAFSSGNRPRWLESLSYHCLSFFNTNNRAHQSGDVENPGDKPAEYQKEHKQFRFLQHLQDTSLMHEQAMKLLKFLISEALKESSSKANKLLGPSMLVAASLGIEEFVKEAVRSYPYVIWLSNDDRHHVFHVAVKHRQEKIYNLLYQMGTHKHFFKALTDDAGNSMLHLAGKLEPSNKISGAALQMQRELQWFKEVEKFVQPSYKELKNDDGKTPREVFAEEHKGLVEQGEKWMKDTATACATVAALVVTVMFAAAFTTPGGNNSDNGFPILLKRGSFLVFAISDALGLCSSSASLLMFLGILTSRYSENDFLMALPMRMSIGLISLFISIASMLAAFTAAFHLVLYDRVSWIAVSIGLAACVPVTLFAVLQLPLLYDMLKSTFGPSIFAKPSHKTIY